MGWRVRGEGRERERVGCEGGRKREEGSKGGRKGEREGERLSVSFVGVIPVLQVPPGRNSMELEGELGTV